MLMGRMKMYRDAWRIEDSKIMVRTESTGETLDAPKDMTLVQAFVPYVLLSLMTIIVLNDLSHAFGKETSYTIGLVILGFVFWTMLGFGASEPVCLDDKSE